MATITFILADGGKRVVEAKPGLSLMQAARDEDVPGILADCGGACACATCHVAVMPEWVSALPAASEVEQQMLEFAVGREDTSRLSCQIAVKPEMDGLIVRVIEP